MPTDWFSINTIVVIVVIGVGAAIFYKALREPLNLLFGLLGKMFGYIRDKLSGTELPRVIEYG